MNVADVDLFYGADEVDGMLILSPLSPLLFPPPTAMLCNSQEF